MGYPTLAPFLGALLASTVVTVVLSLSGRTVTEVGALNDRVPSLGDADKGQGR